MLELLTTRNNPMIDPSLHVWGWEIPVYLFLGGWVAGAMVLSGWLMRRDPDAERPSVTQLLPWIGLVLISLGMVALFLDLEHKLYVWRMYTTFQPTSPMSWGGWILIGVYPVLLLAGIAGLPPALAGAWAPLGALARRLRQADAWRALGLANIVLGVGLGIYTGHPAVQPRRETALGQRRARPAVPGLRPVHGRGVRAHDRARPG